MQFFGRHGLFAEEAALGQRFNVDLTMELSLRAAGESDRMEDSIHYGEAYETVRSVMEEERFNLLEAVAERIADRIMKQDGRIQAVEVAVRKPGAPIPGILDCAEIIIRRERHGDCGIQPGQ